MDIDARLSLSFYKEIATISEAHKIYIVQHIQTQKLYVKKSLSVFNKSVYEYLRDNPISHTPKIYEIFESQDNLTIIEEYISGDTIEQLLENDYAFTEEIIRDIFIQLCTIVKDLHACNPPIIHRDIKPSNIIISPSAGVFLLDFNAAKHLSTNKEEDTSLLGTKGYAAPEQYGFGVSTPQTDIYAIGMLLKDLTDSSTNRDSNIRKAFGAIITKCTKLNSSERYKDVTALRNSFRKGNFANEMSPEWTRFLPPGFRSLSPFYMMIALVGYTLIFWLSLTLEVKDASPHALIAERLFCLLIFISLVFCSGNYLNIQSLFPPCRTRNLFLRTLAVILLDIIVLISLMVLMVFTASLL